MLSANQLAELVIAADAAQTDVLRQVFPQVLPGEGFFHFFRRAIAST